MKRRSFIAALLSTVAVPTAALATPLRKGEHKIDLGAYGNSIHFTDCDGGFDMHPMCRCMLVDVHIIGSAGYG